MDELEPRVLRAERRLIRLSAGSSAGTRASSVPALGAYSLLDPLISLSTSREPRNWPLGRFRAGPHRISGAGARLLGARF
jgi:hypothetical protein